MSAHVHDRSVTSHWYSLRFSFVRDVSLALDGTTRGEGLTKTQLLRHLGRSRLVVLDALVAILAQGALVANMGIKRGRLRRWYALPNPMDTSRLSGHVRERAEEALDITNEGWGRDRDGAFRYETHSAGMSGLPVAIDADFDWAPAWSAAQAHMETSEIELLRVGEEVAGA